ncbi:hypothetical protein B0H16DRAFT_1468032 [Mycena metata]|uniref:Uncharacterized protein n=1 Tax=Mycena metata TaxID=1033252 RepID=A0AAD7MUK8_9AGAR|nr:hypothetical protein B0H16DRAFT_1468032 [Mycena metata]
MATFTTTSITADRRSSNRSSLSSITSITSFASTPSGNIIITERPGPIVVTTTVSTSTRTYPATVPPPFTCSLGSDERLPRPRRGAPPVAPAKSIEERKEQRRRSLVGTLRCVVGLKPPLNPALCKEWW